MSLKENEFFASLVRRLYCVVALRVILILVTTAVLPIAEGVLTNMWSSAAKADKGTIWTVLLTVAAIHLLLAAILLIGELIGPEVKLARAAEVQEESKALRGELRRREEAYRMVRECLTMLTRITCDLPVVAEKKTPVTHPERDTWCQAGFETGLRPVVDAIMANIATTLGVVSTRFTIEAYLKLDYIAGVEQVSDLNGFSLRFFSSPFYDRSVTEKLTNASPALLGGTWDVPNQQHINETKAVFFEKGSPKPHVYFRRFATCPITEPCSDNRMGVLVLTSMQDEPFADDVLDTLQFISSIVSNYVSAYGDCHLDWQRFHILQSLLPDVPEPTRQKLAITFGICDEPMSSVTAGREPPETTTTTQPLSPCPE
jgi:hypothetical protein